jgi:hypothetical protein
MLASSPSLHVTDFILVVYSFIGLNCPWFCIAINADWLNMVA